MRNTFQHKEFQQKEYVHASDCCLLEYELGASCLLGRRSYHLNLPAACLFFSNRVSIYIAQAGLDPPISASWSTGITDVHTIPTPLPREAADLAEGWNWRIKYAGTGPSERQHSEDGMLSHRTRYMLWVRFICSAVSPKPEHADPGVHEWRWNGLHW
jgi:hypothetical protein